MWGWGNIKSVIFLNSGADSNNYLPQDLELAGGLLHL
jgi:hypothetical protein